MSYGCKESQVWKGKKDWKGQNLEGKKEPNLCNFCSYQVLKSFFAKEIAFIIDILAVFQPFSAFLVSIPSLVKKFLRPFPIRSGHYVLERWERERETERDKVCVCVCVCVCVWGPGHAGIIIIAYLSFFAFSPFFPVFVHYSFTASFLLDNHSKKYQKTCLYM